MKTILKSAGLALALTLAGTGLSLGLGVEEPGTKVLAPQTGVILVADDGDWDDDDCRPWRQRQGSHWQYCDDDHDDDDDDWDDDDWDDDDD